MVRIKILRPAQTADLGDQPEPRRLSGNHLPSTCETTHPSLFRTFLHFLYYKKNEREGEAITRKGTGLG